MNRKWPYLQLRELLVDLTSERIFEVQPDDEVIDPTIKSETHTMETAKVSRGANIRVKKRIKLLPGDLVFSRLHTQNGAFAFCDKIYCATTTFVPFKVRADIVERRYLFWALHKYVPTLSASDTVGRETYKTSQILALEIPLPHIDIQKRIIMKIDYIVAKIDEARRVDMREKKELDALLLSVLREFFSDECVMVVTKKVGDICTKPQYGYTNTAEYEPVGPKFLRITDIQNGKVNWDSVPYTSCPEREKYLLATGDVLFARSGATTGKSFLVKSPPESIFASYLIRITPIKGIIPEYLYWFFQSPLYWSQVVEKTSTSAQPNMNGKKLADIQVPLPATEEVQNHIVAFLDAFLSKIEALRRLQIGADKRLQELISSILEKAFEGEL